MKLKNCHPHWEVFIRSGKLKFQTSIRRYKSQANGSVNLSTKTLHFIISLSDIDMYNRSEMKSNRRFRKPWSMRKSGLTKTRVCTTLNPTISNYTSTGKLLQCVPQADGKEGRVIASQNSSRHPSLSLHMPGKIAHAYTEEKPCSSRARSKWDISSSPATPQCRSATMTTTTIEPYCP